MEDGVCNCSYTTDSCWLCWSLLSFQTQNAAFSQKIPQESDGRDRAEECHVPHMGNVRDGTKSSSSRYSEVHLWNSSLNASSLHVSTHTVWWHNGFISWTCECQTHWWVETLKHGVDMDMCWGNMVRCGCPWICPQLVWWMSWMLLLQCSLCSSVFAVLGLSEHFTTAVQMLLQ